MRLSYLFQIPLPNPLSLLSQARYAIASCIWFHNHWENNNWKGLCMLYVHISWCKALKKSILRPGWYYLQDIVAWVTMAAQKVPRTEDIPSPTSTATPLRFFLMPFNYFNVCIPARTRSLAIMGHSIPVLAILFNNKNEFCSAALRGRSRETEKML